MSITERNLRENVEMIRDLGASASASRNYDLAEMCDGVWSVELIDSDTQEQLTAAALGIEPTRYVELCYESIYSGPVRVDVTVNGRRVYAA